MPFGSVAQLVERSTENRKVTGSMPVGATNPPQNGGFFSSLEHEILGKNSATFLTLNTWDF